MRSPLAAWRGGTRWPLILLSLVAALVIAVAICEAIGWPFLAGPLQRAAAKALDRKVVLGPGEHDHSGTRIYLLGSVRLRTPALEIASPSWSDAPHMLKARDVYLKLGYLDLWHAYKGQPLHVKALEAAELDADLQREKDGQASWQFGQKPDQPKPDQPDKPAAALPTFGLLSVEAGHVAYQDELLPAQIDANFALRDSSSNSASAAPAGAASAAAPASAAASAAPDEKSIRHEPGNKTERDEQDKNPAAGKAPPVELAAGETGLRLRAVGNYQKLPVTVDLSTSGALSLLDGRSQTQAQPVRLEARAGKTELHFDGTTTDPLHLSAVNGSFGGSGPSLGAVGDLLGVTLPQTPSFKVDGKLDKSGNVWSAKVAAASIGSSRLAGDFRYDKGRKTPLLSGELSGKRLALADLGPAIGKSAAAEEKANAKTKSRGKVIPDKQFDLPSLRAMDADVKVNIAEFDAGTDVLENLHPMRAHILLADGLLTVADIDANAAKGRLLGSLQLDGRGKLAKWDANLGLRGVDLAQWLKLGRKGDAPPYLSGRLDAKAVLTGTGRSTAEILGSLDGDVKAHIRNATISHLAVEAGGIDIAQALGILIKGDESLKVQCNIIDLDIKHGLVKPRLLVFNTKDSTMWIDGLISLKTESMGLKVIVAPKDFSPLTLRTPIEISGTLSHPSVSIEAGKLAAKAGAAALLATLLQPLAAVLPFVDTGSEDEAKKAGAQCAALVKKSGDIPRPVSRPKDTRVPQKSVKTRS